MVTGRAVALFCVTPFGVPSVHPLEFAMRFLARVFGRHRSTVCTSHRCELRDIAHNHSMGAPR